MMNILDQIVAEKRRELAAAMKRAPEATLRAQAESRTDFRNFRAALRRKDGVGLVAEVKKASPSAGVICPDFDPVAIAKQYEHAGASACSVLTDEQFFQGHLSFLAKIRAATELPLLRKDFIIEDYQVHESAAAGADAILLIVAILDLARVRSLLATANRCRLAVVVEVHDEAELDVALRAEAQIIGINNRNLKDFSVDLGTTERLAARIRQHQSGITNHESRVTLVAESGLHTRADVERVRAAGADAILVGESLMRSGNLAGKVRELLGATEAQRTQQ